MIYFNSQKSCTIHCKYNRAHIEGIHVPITAFRRPKEPGNVITHYGAYEVPATTGELFAKVSLNVHKKTDFTSLAV
jgi:hypothetical protein